MTDLDFSFRSLVRGLASSLRHASDAPATVEASGPVPALFVHSSDSAATDLVAGGHGLEQDGIATFGLRLPERDVPDTVKDALVVNAEVNRIRLVTGSRTVDAVADAASAPAANLWRERFQAAGSNGRVIPGGSAIEALRGALLAPRSRG